VLAGVLVAALALLALGAFEQLATLPAAGRSLLACRAAAMRISELAAPAPIGAPELADLRRGRPRRAGEGSLCARGLSFRYGRQEPWVLEDVSFALGAGERVALVGASGAGKSTLGELLTGVLVPVGGEVLLDGVDTRRLAGEELRRAVLLAGQDSRVFNTTLRENLLLADRCASELRLWGALETVELGAWASSLPQGLDTLVGQGGELASGGQQTRIALARALLSPSRFAVLDEPTAHLQAALAGRIMGRLARLEGERGLLVITHGVDALEGYDRVLELADGRLAERAALLAA